MPKNIMAALNYNEKKLQQGKAICLHAANYLGSASDMNFYQKLAGFERLNCLNERATTKTLHVSLNFDPSEKLDNEKLCAIASMYMDKIGFGRQPFLVYKHLDAGHPHIHIVSTTIQKNGTRINTHNIGRNQSEKARKELEQRHGLIKAQRQQANSINGPKPLNIQKAIYGKAETKQSISSIVTAVFNQYKFTSLPEFNAALQQFNVIADRGKVDGRIYKHKGLTYRILDADGNKIGVPIKASLLGCRPTLVNLEKKFAMNQEGKEQLQAFLRAKVDACLAQRPDSMQDLVRLLQQKEIHTSLRQNETGRIYGVTFVDNVSKIVCNGSDVGKGYSAMGLQTRFANNNKWETPHSKINSLPSKHTANSTIAHDRREDKSLAVHQKIPAVIDALLSVKDNHEPALNVLLKKKRTRKKRQPNQ